MDLERVRSHLEEAANVSGWNSDDIRPESELIKSIVGDILRKLNQRTLKLPSNLVGIGSHIERIETLLCLESPQFHIVGLWGMGGIGKTTIVQAIFKHICSRFDAFHFVENVANELKSQSVDGLREKMVSKLLEEEILQMGNRTLRHDFVMKQLQHKRVLIVLDDVNDATDFEKLLWGENDHVFSRGSRILITSRDKQVLKNIVSDQNLIYEVKGLNEEDGLKLFSLRAFKQNNPTRDRLELSKRVLRYTRGNPLALVVLGNALLDKSKEEWVSALDELGEEPFPDIQKVLRVSYDALCDEEKKIFVDVACFLVGQKFDSVVGYYNGCIKRIEYKISNLVDKSLITISQYKEVKMHALLIEMGRSIESTKGLEERTRIWNLNDVTRLFLKTHHQGNSMIEAIKVDLFQSGSISEFDCNVLSRLDGLRYLEVYGAWNSKMRFCWEGFRGFPKELRYLSWSAYPQTSLPSNFCAENLVELHMPSTEITKLWRGKQNIVNLKVIILSGSRKLVEFPDVSKGRNIQVIDLSWCDSLVKISPSVQHLPKLEHFTFENCENVKSAPATFDSKLLTILGLCRGFKIFPRLASANVIRHLRLDETDTREVPSSVELLKVLEIMSMEGCKKLSIISTNICKLKFLSELVLSGCTNLESFPEIMEPMESLKILYLNGCTKLKWLPNSFHNLKSLVMLYLDYTAITGLPSSIQHLSCLELLTISGCQNLTSLPSCIHTFRNLRLIEAKGCVSLKTISSEHFASESKIINLKFANCWNLDEEEHGRLLDIVFSNLSQGINYDEEVDLMMPWSEIPEWLCCTQSVGSSLTLELPIDDQCYRLAFCVIINPIFPNSLNSQGMDGITCYVDDEFNEFSVYDDPYEFSVTSYFFERLWNDVEHLLLWSNPLDVRLREYFGGEVTLQFYNRSGAVEVIKCGVLIIPVEDM